MSYTIHTTVEYELRGPGSCQVRLAKIEEVPGRPGIYQIFIDGKVSYYGMTFTWEEAMERVKWWGKSGKIVVTQLSRKRHVEIKQQRSSKSWGIFI